MRKKTLLLLAFVLVLYIAPMIFGPSYERVTTPAQQNSNKEFSPSVEHDYGIHLATDGEGDPSETGDYTDTWIKDGSSMFNVDASAPYEPYLELEFTFTEQEFDAIYLNFYGYAWAVDTSLTTKELVAWNGSTWNDLGDIGEDSAEWTNVTLDSSYVLTPSDTVYMRARAVDNGGCSVNIDYAEVALCNFSYESGEWHNKAWSYRKIVQIEGASGAGTNYQVNIDVPFTTGMQSDFDDIRFCDNNGVTLLDYWLEEYTASTTASFWVEVKDNLDTEQMIYMYWGNDAVSTTSDGEATFLLFDDFEDNNLDNWADTTNMQTTSARTHDGSSYSASWSSDANSYLQDNTFNGLSGIHISYWTNDEDSLRGSFVCGYTEADYSENTATVRSGYETGTSPIYWRDTGVYTAWSGSADDLDDDTWNRIELALDFNDDEMQTWQNGVANDELTLVEDDGTACETEELDGFAIYMQATKQCWFDDVIVRKYVDPEPTYLISERTENAPPYAWEDAGTATIYFNVPYDETGLNMFLIVAGLVLLPISTMLLVKGGKEEMSQDKMFFFCVLFLFGWVLFLGGIM